ncbi:MAG: toll/interleukin-1 receptor domain-containing protein [Chloroflexota bacterium]
MAHVFISYSREDVAFARYMRATLEHADIPVWMDEKRLSTGMDWWDEIEANIDVCSAFLVIMSPDSRQSVFVRNEILRAIDEGKMLFPVLLRGKHFGMLAHVQYEDMRGGLNDALSANFMRRLQALFGEAETRAVTIEVVHNAIETVESDVVLLKYAKAFHGADNAVKKRLNGVGVSVNTAHLKTVGNYDLLASEDALASAHVMYVGTEWVGRFGYRQVREFAERGLRVIADELPETRHISMTVHGVNTRLNLDETESVLAQLAGMMDVIQGSAAPAHLERISIVEIDVDRVERLKVSLSEYFDELDTATPTEDDKWAYTLTFTPEKAPKTPNAGEAEVKPYAVAIFPQIADLEDAFHYGIKRVVHGMGLLCERMDNTIEDDETVQETTTAILERIGKARAVVCDVTQMTPLLYLQIGYALGRGIPVATIAHDEPTSDLVPLTIRYEKIWQLEERLGKWIRGEVV